MANGLYCLIADLKLSGNEEKNGRTAGRSCIGTCKREIVGLKSLVSVFARSVRREEGVLTPSLSRASITRLSLPRSDCPG